ncbi:MAG TPA: hypothetical protein VGJ21_10030 [Terracidiphilus sp.]|jgi:hypothetical protein
MGWVEDRLEKQAQEADRREQIEGSASAIYDELWEAVVKVTKLPTVAIQWKPQTNGNPFHRTVVDLHKRILQIDLRKDRQSITATIGEETVARLDLVVDKNNVVHLAQGGRKLDYEEAAQVVMEPFLFPAS